MLAAGNPPWFQVVGAEIPVERLLDAVTVILSYQNSDGGMATYENTRSFHWLEVRLLDMREVLCGWYFCIYTPSSGKKA